MFIKLFRKIKVYYMRKTTIFKQLILNVVIPAVSALLILGAFNYSQTKSILIDASDTKSKIISEEIIDIMEIQDVALEIIEQYLNPIMESYSNELVNNYFKKTDNIEFANLDEIRIELGMDPEMEDIYIINEEGIVVNSTFEADLGLNLFSFGEEHKHMILGIFEEEKFVYEKFTVESSTKRLKKYTYHPTLDGKYIVELGIYSGPADELINSINKTVNELSDVNVDLFINKDNPISLTKDIELSPDEIDLMKERFVNQDSIKIPRKVNRKKLYYNYLYIHRANTDLYKGAIISIINER